MKNTTLILVATLAACSADTTSSGPDKVGAEAAEMSLDPDGDGVAEGTIAGERASMSFALSKPLPKMDDFRSTDGSADAAVIDMVDAFDLVVSSPRSGATVSLVYDGDLVESPPSGPGEWSIVLADDRRSMTVSWYNQTRNGLTLKAGQVYDVAYSLGDNCCVAKFGTKTTQFRL